MSEYPDDAARLEQGRRLAQAEGREPPSRIQWGRTKAERRLWELTQEDEDEGADDA